jgi:hypothetical protein
MLTYADAYAGGEAAVVTIFCDDNKKYLSSALVQSEPLKVLTLLLSLLHSLLLYWYTSTNNDAEKRAPQGAHFTTQFTTHFTAVLVQQYK